MAEVDLKKVSVQIKSWFGRGSRVLSMKSGRGQFHARTGQPIAAEAAAIEGLKECLWLLLAAGKGQEAQQAIDAVKAAVAKVSGGEAGETAANDVSEGEPVDQ